MRCCESQVTVLHALRQHGKETIPPALQQFSELERIKMTVQKVLQATAEELIQEAKKRLQARGVTQITERVEIGNPAERIADIAKRFDSDLTVMGRHGLGARSADCCSVA